METFKEWILKRFNEDELADLAKYGAVGGFSGITYYCETTHLYQKYQDEIWGVLSDDADNFGVSVLKLISSFGGSENVTDSKRFANLLVWYAAEKIAYEATNHEE